MKLLLMLLIGIVAGLGLSEWTSVYRISCDTTKFGYMWVNQHRFTNEPVRCRNSNQVVERETSLYMISQTVWLEIKSLTY